MAHRLLETSPAVASNRQQVAVTRGPLVYCVEAADNPGVNLNFVEIGDAPVFEEVLDRNLLGGVVRIETAANEIDGSGWNGELYLPVGEASASRRQIPLRFIPYYAWANRAPGPMRVWVPLA